MPEDGAGVPAEETQGRILGARVQGKESEAFADGGEVGAREREA